MRKMSMIMLVIAAVSCGVVFGGPKYSESKVAIVKSGEVFKVIYQGPEEGRVKVSILDQDQNLIFTEHIISHGKFMRPYNFAMLPKGDYKICIDEEHGQHLEKICNTETDVPDVQSEKTLNAHVIKLKDAENKYMVSVPHQSDGDVAIQIFDQEHQLIYSEDQPANRDFAKIYALKNLEGATITVVNKSSGKEKRFQAD